MNEATGIDCTGTISVIIDMEKFDTVEAALNQLIDGNSDLVMETIKQSITYYSGLQQLSFGVLLIVAVIVAIIPPKRFSGFCNVPSGLILSASRLYGPRS